MRITSGDQLIQKLMTNAHFVVKKGHLHSSNTPRGILARIGEFFSRRFSEKREALLQSKRDLQAKMQDVMLNATEGKVNFQDMRSPTLGMTPQDIAGEVVARVLAMQTGLNIDVENFAVQSLMFKAVKKHPAADKFGAEALEHCLKQSLAAKRLPNLLTAKSMEKMIAGTLNETVRILEKPKLLIRPGDVLDPHHPVVRGMLEYCKLEWCRSCDLLDPDVFLQRLEHQVARTSVPKPLPSLLDFMHDLADGIETDMLGQRLLNPEYGPALDMKNPLLLSMIDGAASAVCAGQDLIEPALVSECVRIAAKNVEVKSVADIENLRDIIETFSDVAMTALSSPETLALPDGRVDVLQFPMQGLISYAARELGDPRGPMYFDMLGQFFVNRMSETPAQELQENLFGKFYDWKMEAVAALRIPGSFRGHFTDPSVREQLDAAVENLAPQFPEFSRELVEFFADSVGQQCTSRLLAGEVMPMGTPENLLEEYLSDVADPSANMDPGPLDVTHPAIDMLAAYSARLVHQENPAVEEDFVTRCLIALLRGTVIEEMEMPLLENAGLLAQEVRAALERHGRNFPGVEPEIEKILQDSLIGLIEPVLISANPDLPQSLLWSMAAVWMKDKEITESGDLASMRTEGLRHAEEAVQSYRLPLQAVLPDGSLDLTNPGLRGVILHSTLMEHIAHPSLPVGSILKHLEPVLGTVSRNTISGPLMEYVEELTGSIAQGLENCYAARPGEEPSRSEVLIRVAYDTIYDELQRQYFYLPGDLMRAAAGIMSKSVEVDSSLSLEQLQDVVRENMQAILEPQNDPAAVVRGADGTLDVEAPAVQAAISCIVSRIVAGNPALRPGILRHVLSVLMTSLPVTEAGDSLMETVERYVPDLLLALEGRDFNLDVRLRFPASGPLVSALSGALVNKVLELDKFDSNNIYLPFYPNCSFGAVRSFNGQAPDIVLAGEVTSVEEARPVMASVQKFLADITPDPELRKFISSVCSDDGIERTLASVLENSGHNEPALAGFARMLQDQHAALDGGVLEMNVTGNTLHIEHIADAGVFVHDTTPGIQQDVFIVTSRIRTRLNLDLNQTVAPGGMPVFQIGDIAINRVFEDI